MAQDSIRAHNEVVKQQQGRAEKTPRKPWLDLSPLGNAVVTAVLALAIGLAWWHLTAPLVNVEKPPSAVELTKIAEVADPAGGGFYVVQAEVKNSTDRVASKVVYLVKYPGMTPQDTITLVAENLQAGETRQLTYPLYGVKQAPATHVVTPFSIQWKK